MSGIYGVREGTVVAALIVGPIVHFVTPYYHFLDKWITDSVKTVNAESRHSQNIVITIAREYGSGGHYTRPSSEYNMLFTGASYISGISGRQRFVFPNSVIEETDASGNVTYRENTDITVNDAGKTFWNGIYKQGRANQIISAASWRLRELSLGYDVPKKYLKKVGFLQRASVSLVGRNLFMWTPSTNIWGDPDFTGSGNGNVGGFSGTNNVGQRSYGFNLLLSF